MPDLFQYISYEEVNFDHRTTKIDKGISDIVGALADPIIVYPGGWGDEMLEMRLGPKVVLMAKLIHGTFPNYHQLIPKDTDVSVTLVAEWQEVHWRSEYGTITGWCSRLPTC